MMKVHEILAYNIYNIIYMPIYIVIRKDAHTVRERIRGAGKVYMNALKKKKEDAIAEKKLKMDIEKSMRDKLNKEHQRRFEKQMLESRKATHTKLVRIVDMNKSNEVKINKLKKLISKLNKQINK